MIRRNAEVRKAVKEAGITLWMLAQIMGISEATMTRKLRNELSEDEKRNMLQIIKKNRVN